MLFENARVYNMREAVLAARLSWDSQWASDTREEGGAVEIGKDDRALIEKLIRGGPSHRKFMRAILLSVDITAPRYWWTQFDTYKVGVTALSESTMHTIMKKPLEMSDFAFKKDMYVEVQLVNALEEIRKSGDFARLIALLPQAYKQKRHVAMNYEVVRNIISQRRHHKLSEWGEFCDWARELPNADIFFGDLLDGD